MISPYIRDPDLTLYAGDARDVLRALPDESVHCIVTSPPYWGLRDYGTARWEGGDPECEHQGSVARTAPAGTEKQASNAGAVSVRSGDCACGARRVDPQIGLEGTPDEYVIELVAIFREARRVLRDDGTLWLNLGDSYATGAGSVGDHPGGGKQGERWAGRGAHGHDPKRNNRDAYGPLTQPNRMPIAGLKPKDLVGIPWRVAFALQADGWFLRSDIVWHKPNPMPESVTDWPTKTHEYLFLLAKSERYFFDQEAVRERFTDPERKWWVEPRTEPGNPDRIDGGGVQSRPARRNPLIPEQTENGDGRHGLGSDTFGQPAPNGRNVRSVWTIATEPFAEAHFATFPEELPRRCILAGTSEHGCCPQCGAPWERIIIATGPDGRRAEMRGGKAYDESGEPLIGDNMFDHGVRGSFNHGGRLLIRETAGWRPRCECDGPDTTPIGTPTGTRAGDDPSLETGRAGMNRPRGANEGRRTITRFEQREYARQLRESPNRPQMEIEAERGAFAHYIRTDKSGARPVPPDLLERWIANGWLERVEIPAAEAPAALVPAVVLDPFAGAGTTLHVARKLGRHAVGIELNPDYAAIVARRTAQQSLFADAGAAA